MTTLSLGAGRCHLAEHEIDVDHEVDVGIFGHVGVDRHQVIRTVDFDAMAGVIEKSGVGALHLIAELFDDVPEFVLVEIELGAAADEHEAERPQSLGHQTGIVLRVGQGTRVAVTRIADHERDPFVGRSGRR